MNTRETTTDICCTKIPITKVSITCQRYFIKWLKYRDFFAKFDSNSSTLELLTGETALLILHVSSETPNRIQLYSKSVNFSQQTCSMPIVCCSCLLQINKDSITDFGINKIEVHFFGRLYKKFNESWPCLIKYRNFLPIRVKIRHNLT